MSRLKGTPRKMGNKYSARSFARRVRAGGLPGELRRLAIKESPHACGVFSFLAFAAEYTVNYGILCFA